MRQINQKQPFSLHRLKLAALAAMSVTAAAYMSGAQAASATASATATVVAPIAISKAADLRFGKLSAGTGGTVVMSPAGARTATGGVVLLSGTAGGAASFSVTGDANATYAITLPTSATISDSATTPNTMTVDTFTSSPATTGTLSSAGAQTVAVGATLKVGNAQVQGTYNGTFSVAVEYN